MTKQTAKTVLKMIIEHKDLIVSEQGDKCSPSEIHKLLKKYAIKAYPNKTNLEIDLYCMKLQFGLRKRV